MSDKERVSLAIEPELLARFDTWIERSGGNRSEVMRDLIRARLLQTELETHANVEIVATVTLVYDHNKRELSERLIELGHDHHHRTIATLHVHLDQDHCLEVVVLRGPARRLKELADQLIAMKGVHHGQAVFSRSAP